MTLEELLALLPDNSTGAIDAADLRIIVTEMWNRDASLEARLSALEEHGGVVSAAGIWQWNPVEGGVPQATQVTVDAIPITEATWARFWPVELNNRDMRNFLLLATRAYVQNESNAEDWASYDVPTPSVEFPTYIEVPLALRSFAGSSDASQWQRVLVVLTIPTPVLGG